jgi:hypothetical protein
MVMKLWVHKWRGMFLPAKLLPPHNNNNNNNTERKKGGKGKKERNGTVFCKSVESTASLLHFSSMLSYYITD